MEAAAEEPLFADARLALQRAEEVIRTIQAGSTQPEDLEPVAPRKPQHYGGGGSPRTWAVIEDEALQCPLRNELSDVAERRPVERYPSARRIGSQFYPGGGVYGFMRWIWWEITRFATPHALSFRRLAQGVSFHVLI